MVNTDVCAGRCRGLEHTLKNVQDLVRDIRQQCVLVVDKILTFFSKSEIGIRVAFFRASLLGASIL